MAASKGHWERTLEDYNSIYIILTVYIKVSIGSNYDILEIFLRVKWYQKKQNLLQRLEIRLFTLMELKWILRF